ncbi:2019_t:CDS:2, partial [Entrophospora sp. SA101]
TWLVCLQINNHHHLRPNRQKRNWTWTYFKSDHNDQEEPKIEPDKLKSLRSFILDTLKSNYEWIELQLSDDWQWLLDANTPSIGDIHVAMNIWFLNTTKDATKEFGNISELYPKIHQWFGRFIKFIKENQQHKPLKIS